MPFDVDELEEEQKPQYQVVNGFRLPVPQGAGAGSELTADAGAGAPPAPTLREVTRGGLPIRTPQAMPNSAMPAEVAPPDPSTVAPSSTPSIDSLSASAPKRLPPAPIAIDKQQTPGMPSVGDLMRQYSSTGTRIDPRDPATGKTQDKYRMGMGSRILGTVGNFLSGFGGDRRAPTFVGPGATNRRYDQDEAQRESRHASLGETIGQQEKVGDESRKLFDSATRAAYETQVGEARRGTSEAQQQVADARQTAADATAKLNDAKSAAMNAGVTYDAARGQFKKNGQVYVPKSIEEGATLETAFGVKNGQYSQMWKQERKNQPININTGRTPKLSARDQMKLDGYAKRTGKSVDDLSDKEINEALSGKSANQRGTPAQFSKLDADKKKSLDKAEADYKNGVLTDADLFDVKQQIQNDYEQRIGDLGGESEHFEYDQQPARRATSTAAQPAASASTPTPASAAPPAPAAARPAAAAAAPVRTAHQVGDVVKVKGQSVKITKLLPNGKYEGIPAP